jgi:hypothetical protein
MPSLADSSRRQDISDQSSAYAEIRLPTMAAPSRLFRLLLWFVRTLGPEVYTAVPVRVYYKFDSGCWRIRNTHQLHKGYRCR